MQLKFRVRQKSAGYLGDDIGYELTAHTSQFTKRFYDFARQISFRNIKT